MNRRHVMTSMGGLGLIAAAQTTSAPAVAAPAAAPQQKVDRALMDAVSHCIKVAKICQAHCQLSLGTGDTMLKDCNRTVSELLPVCEALSELTARESALLSKYAKVAMEFCAVCEKECRKHENHHQQCKDCADACLACAKECKRVAA